MQINTALDTNLNELTLMQAVADNNAAAFRQLVRDYQPLLLSYLRCRCRDEGLAEELTNDVLLQAWRSASSFAGRSKLKTWLLGIANNCCCNAHRGRRLELLPASAADSAPRSDTEPRSNPETYSETIDRANALWRAVRELSADQRQVIELSFFQDRRYHEIAQIVNCPKNTVKTRMFHAKRQLLRVLQPQLAQNATA